MSEANRYQAVKEFEDAMRYKVETPRDAKVSPWGIKTDPGYLDYLKRQEEKKLAADKVYGKMPGWMDD